MGVNVKRNERTSKRIAGIAGAILSAPVAAAEMAQVRAKSGGQWVMPWRNLRALAASALTQSPDRAVPKRKRRMRRK
jgi:hypothetical protein